MADGGIANYYLLPVVENKSITYYPPGIAYKGQSGNTKNVNNYCLVSSGVFKDSATGAGLVDWTS